MAAVALRLALALLVCAALCSAQNYTDPLDMLSLINSYDHCHVYYGGAGSAVTSTPLAVIFWTLNTTLNEIDIGYTCSGSSALGYCALGITNRNTAIMYPADAAIFFAGGTGGDYTIGPNAYPDTTQVRPAYPGSTPAITPLSQDSIQDVTVGSITPSFGGRKLSIQYTRPINSPDPADLPINVGVSRQVLVSSRLSAAANAALGYHNNFKMATDAWDWQNAPGCPNNCAGKGTCTKGCCVCQSGYGGYDCSLTPGTTPVGTGTDLSVYTNSGNIGTRDLDGKFSIHWRFQTLTTLNDALQVALEIEDENPATRWVAFGWGSRMDTADAWVFTGPTFSSVDDFYLGTGKHYRAGSVATDVSYGGTNDLLGFSSAYNATSKRWVLSVTRRLDTGDSFDRVLNANWNNFIWSQGPKGENSLTSGGHPYNRKERGRINLTTGKIDLKTDLRVAHGAIMFVAYAVLMVAGAIVARYFKSMGPAWFHIHRALMWTALALIIAGLVIILVWVPKGSHFRRAHPRLGIAIIGLTIVQPFIGIAADIMFDENRSRTPVFPDLIHWAVGWITIILMLVNISLGVTLIGASDVVTGLWYAWLVLVIVGNIGLFCYFFFVKKFTGLKKH